MDYKLLIYVSVLIICAVAIIIATVYIFRYTTKKLRRSSSLIVPMLYDHEQKRIRMIDVKYLDSAQEVFGHREHIYSGNWLSINEFSKTITENYRDQFLENIETWEHEFMDVVIADRTKNKKIDSYKKYSFMFTESDNEKMILIFRNKVSKITIKPPFYLRKKIKFSKFRDIKNSNKNFHLYISFSLKQIWNSEKSVKQIMERFFTWHPEYSFIINEIIYEDGVLSLGFRRKNKKALPKIKTRLIKKFLKFRNNYFYNEIAVIAESSYSESLIYGPRIKPLVNYSLWKSSQQKTIFELDLPYVIDYSREMEAFGEAKDQYKRLVNNDAMPITEISILKRKKPIDSKIIYPDVPKKVMKFFNEREKERLFNELASHYLENPNPNSIIFINSSLFLKQYKTFNENTPSLIIKTRNYSSFLKEFKNQIHENDFKNWGLYVDRLNIHFFSLLKELKPQFLVISYLITEHLENSGVALSLETLLKICKLNTISIIYEFSENEPDKIHTKRLDVIFNYKIEK
ncbi:MHO_4530 family protein [Mycoplasma procyoni]|uniref:MHO_4530 family protein n=1 Tax=Mycoplasma procyoni TaxID=568784 RepID=UPI00197CA954|nr:hypothetical protein [Mycoplasma procyoni]MBN3534554.1 hypothetical protein [Mycoplasma procyoni]